MYDIQGSGTHLQKEMMVVNDKDYNMITVLVERWAVAIYTAWSNYASMRFLVNMPGMHVTAFSHHESAVEEIEPPRNIVLNKDFTQLKTRYHSILQLMPDNYEQSVGMLLNYISDDQICMILSSSNSTTANKIILDCLIERMSCREELLDLCDQLETITASQQLKMMINEIRSDAQKSSQFPTFTTNIQSLSSNQQHYSTSPGLNSPLYQMTFSDMKLDSSSKILPVLKKNYARLCHCLPQDYVKTVHKLKQLIPEVSADYLAWLRTLPSTDLINEAIIGNVMCAIRADYGVFEFCDVIENLCDEVTSRNLIGALRNEFLEALCSPPPTTTTTNTLLPNNGVNSSSGSHHPITLHQTSNNSSLRVEPTPVVSTSTPSQPNQSFDSSRAALQEQLNYQHQRLERGIKCPPPPTLPPNYVPRQHLLEEMVSKLCQSTIDPNNCGTSLTVTGAGGFGKTSIITALCHHPVIKEQFRDGIVFIELGPQATDPSMKLSQIYHLLTDQYLQQGDVNHAEQEINQLTSLYCRNLLVIIDDVWHFEDAEPIVKAFSNCKIVLTTRMNDIEQYIPTKQVVSVGPMEQSEAISLLTCGVIDISQLSQEDVRLLDELAQDVNLWPLLLSLIRGQLSHNLKHHKLCYHEVIQLVQANLRDKGLTAFDKNNIGRSRKYAAKLCIEVTLQLLTESLSNRLKSLLLWTGIGTSVQTAVLHSLWKIAEYEARNDVDVLWAYGLVQFTNSIIPPHNNTQHCVEIHVVISQYIIECMYSNEVRMLSPYGRLGTHESVRLKSLELFQISSGIYDVSLLCGRDYLKYKVSEIENHFLPYSLKRINMFTIVEPHNVIVILQKLQYALMNSPNITAFFPSLTDEIESLISESHKILHDAHKMSRPLNQNVQRCLTQRNYHNLIQTIKMYVKQYPIPMLAQQAVFMVNKIIPYCDGELLENIMWGYKYLQTMTPDYHYITLMTLPYLELRTEHLQRLYASIQPGSLDMESTQHYFKSRQHIKEIDSVDKNYLNELKKIHSEITNLHIIQSSKT
ncbi:uncharacterized protein [Dysidea avara]|uniref:uncharacterized protein isoform X2 n=1 Tax=Dysidea avara TaxID=196820 RepID=UPI003333C921